MRTLALVLVLLITPACHAPVTITTQQGKVAYSADQVALRVNELQNAAIAANAAGNLPTNTTRTIVQFCVTADQTLAATPTGWAASLSTAWAGVKAQLPPISNPAIVAAMGAVDVVLGVSQ